MVALLEPGRLGLLPAFLRHYRSLGVDAFHLAAHIDPQLPEPERIASADAFRLAFEEHGLQPAAWLERTFDTWVARECLDGIIATLDADWILPVDLDEFQEYPAPLCEIVARAVAMNATVVRGTLLDRFAPGGRLPELDPAQPLEAQFTLRLPFTRDVLKANARKVVLARRGVRIGLGNHDPAPDQDCVEARDRAIVHHFKWDATLGRRLARRLTPEWRTRCPWWTESARVLDRLREGPDGYHLDDLFGQH